MPIVYDKFLLVCCRGLCAVRGALILLGPYALREKLIKRIVAHFRGEKLELTNVGVVRLASTLLSRRCTRLHRGSFFNVLGSSVGSAPIVTYYFRNVRTMEIIQTVTNTAGKQGTSPKAVHKSCYVDGRRGVMRASSSLRGTTIRLTHFFTPRRVFSCGSSDLSCLCTGSRLWGGG